MTPTLQGWLQTRVFAALTVGVAWTALLTPFLAGATYGMTYATLTLMALLGLGGGKASTTSSSRPGGTRTGRRSWRW